MNFLPQNANTAATGRLPWLATSSGRGSASGPTNPGAPVQALGLIQAQRGQSRAAEAPDLAQQQSLPTITWGGATFIELGRLPCSHFHGMFSYFAVFAKYTPFEARASSFMLRTSQGLTHENHFYWLAK